MKIKISGEESMVAGYITWQRLARDLFQRGGELQPGETVTHFEVGERGINYFIARGPAPTLTE